MIPIGPIGLDALAAIGDEALSWAWLTVPVFLLALAALVLRYRMARTAARRFDSKGNGRWLDGRTSTRATLSSGSGGAAELDVLLASFRRRQKGSDPSVVELAGDVVLTLDSGSIVRLPARSLVSVEVGVSPKIARRIVAKTESTADGSMLTVQLVAKEGATVWLVAHVESASGDGPLRTGATAVLTSAEGIALHFFKPRADETSFAGAYTLTMFAIANAVLLAMADGPSYVLPAFEGLFALLAVLSIRGSLKNRAALAGDSTSAGDRP
ncbi:MAG: hypothetical protein JNK05_23820 [Myxococcales bacterium]|nr:hypothetical protein [Myxococcales bacterium]